MIKKYTFIYNSYEAEACFTVDTSLFTNEHALATLNFFDWDWDKEGDPIDEVMKKYAMKAIRIASFESYNLNGVINEFKESEGYGNVDGSIGITLTSIDEYEFDEDNLEMKID